MGQWKSLRSWLDEIDAVSFLQCCVQCNTVNPPGHEEKLADMISSLLHRYNIEHVIHRYEGGRANLIAVVKGSRPGKSLVLNGHLDTVPVGKEAWKHPPFAGVIHDNKMYGRGTSDMKGGVVALLYVFIYFSTNRQEWGGELHFCTTFGEETGGEGARLLMEEGHLPHVDALLIAEPTDNQPVVAHKGVLWLEISSKGQTAHASMPETGVNALDVLLDFARHLKEYKLSQDHEWLTPSTLNLTMIQGGVQANVIPDHAQLTVDIRTVPGIKHDVIVNQLNAIKDSVCKSHQGSQLSIRRLLDLPPVTTSIHAEIVQVALQSLQRMGLPGDRVYGKNYFTDGSIFTQYRDVPILIMGPGHSEQAHQTNEYLDLEQFYRAVDIYHHISTSYLMNSNQ